MTEVLAGEIAPAGYLPSLEGAIQIARHPSCHLTAWVDR